MNLDKEYIKKVSEAWDKTTCSTPARNKWWHSGQIIKHMNWLICGEELEGWNVGAVKQLSKVKNKFSCAISIGCGEASKEMSFLEQGIVEKFICFELSEKRIEKAVRAAKEKGLENRIEVIYGNFFESEYAKRRYDLVFWDNSIHHMPDVYEAVQKSMEILEEDGIFFCNDYIGESRFQWSDEKLKVVNDVRKCLPREVFKTSSKEYRQEVNRPSIEAMMKMDPSEAADSENVLPAVRDVFANPYIKMTGGVMYLIGLDGIIENIPDYSPLMNYMIEIDDLAIKNGLSMYAFILARKNGEALKLD